MKRLFIPLSVAVLLNGCSLHKPLELETRELRLGHASPVEVSESVQLRWEELFRSDNLQRLIEVALKENPDIGMAWDRLVVARAIADADMSGQYPEWNIELRYQDTRQTDVEGETEDSRVVVGSMLSWELDLWKRISSQIQSARKITQATREDFEGTRLTLIAEVITHYLDICYRLENEQLLHRQIETDQKLIELIRERVIQGKANRLDLLQQQSQLLETQNLIPENQRDLDRLCNGLAILLGKIPADLDRSRFSLPEIHFPQTLPSVSMLPLHRPDLRATYARLEAADYQVASTMAERMPRIQVSLEWLWSGPNLSSIGKWDSREWLAGGVMPIFDGFRNKHQVVQAKAEVERESKNYRKQVLNAVREVEDALSEIRSVNEQLANKRHQLELIESQLNAAVQRYVLGERSYLEVLDVIRQKSEAERLLLELRNSQSRTIITLYKAFGATWNLSDE